jgi:hypothetical protein
MFSHYSWWDFAKFVLVLLVPYYAFVAWKYYREDIREWFGGRGEANPSPAEEGISEEEEPSSSLFEIKDYSESAKNQQPFSQVEEAVELSGPVVAEQPAETFNLPLGAQPQNLAELSVDEAIGAAHRIQTDESGAAQPVDANDAPARRLAAAINNQQGRDAFAGFQFNR